MTDSTGSAQPPDHEHQPPTFTHARTRSGRVVHARCIVASDADEATLCGAEIIYRLGNKLRPGQWIEVRRP